MKHSWRIQWRRLQNRFSRRPHAAWSLFWIYLATLSVASVVGDRGLLSSYKLWQQRQRVDQEIIALQADLARLHQDITLFRTDRRTVEKYAREELHLVGRNEIQYIFP